MAERIAKLHEQVDSIHKLSYEYHTADSDNRSMAADLSARIQILADDLRRLDILSVEQKIQLIVGIRRAITLKNFETNDFVHKRLDDPLLKRISRACEDLKVALGEGFRP